MIVAIHTDHPAADRRIDFQWIDPNGDPLVPNYHETLLQLSGEGNLDAIIIPFDPPFLFSVRDMLEHIRLTVDNPSVSLVPVYVELDNAEDFDAVQDEVEDIANSFSFVLPEDQLLSLDTPISDLAFRKLFPLLGRKPQFTDRHYLANEWGSYRLLHQLNLLGYEISEIDIVRRQISKDVYFKRLLLESKYTPKYAPNVYEDFREYFTFIKKTHPKIAIIDDDYLKGWDRAYGALFPQCSIKGFEYTEGEPRFVPETASNYDLIILDLRLTETSEHNESDIVDIDEMSGMKKLKEIRKVDPLVPIIMCTASNKSWSYQTALNNGSNGYWEKESPDFGIGSDYNLKNTLNLINTITEVLSWSREISPVFKQLDKITSLMHRQELRDRIAWKRDVIAGQLQNPPSKYVREHFHLDSEKVAFLIAWSIINEIKEYSAIEDHDGRITTLFKGDDEEFCSFEPDRSDSNKHRLSDFAASLINKPEHMVYFNHRSNYEFLFMKFLFYLCELEDKYKEYNRIRLVRNGMDYIHGQDSAKSSEPYKSNDLVEILKLWAALLSSGLGATS